MPAPSAVPGAPARSPAPLPSLGILQSLNVFTVIRRPKLPAGFGVWPHPRPAQGTVPALVPLPHPDWHNPGMPLPTAAPAQPWQPRSPPCHGSPSQLLLTNPRPRPVSQLRPGLMQPPPEGPVGRRTAVARARFSASPMAAAVRGATGGKLIKGTGKGRESRSGRGAAGAEKGRLREAKAVGRKSKGGLSQQRGRQKWLGQVKEPS